MEHEADHRQGDHRFRDLLQRLVILGQPPPSPKPAERSSPPIAAAARRSRYCLRHADDDQRQAEQTTGEQSGEPAWRCCRGTRPGASPEAALCASAGRRGCQLLDVGRMHEDPEQQPVGVHRNLALATFSRLAASEPRGPSLSVVFTLWVFDDRRRRPGLPPRARAQHDHDLVAHARPHPIPEKSAHVPVHGAPGRESRGGGRCRD